jgi:hypothetical protein
MFVLLNVLYVYLLNKQTMIHSCMNHIIQGKHTPPKYQEQHVTKTDKDVPIEYTLPLVTIRDPYNWMQVCTMICMSAV